MIRLKSFAGLWGLIICGCIGCFAQPDISVMQDFDRAEQTFSSAKNPDEFLEAAIAYQGILDQGFRSGIVLYNQGNAFMNANQRGRAIAAYRQAQRLRPRDVLLEANLQTALAGVAVPRQQPLMESLLFWQNWVGYSTKFVIATLLLLTTVVCGLLAVFLRNVHCKRAAWAFLAVSVLAAISCGWDWYRFEVQQNGVIVAQTAIPRKGNADSYEPAFNKELPEGTEFTVAEQRDNWLLIDVPAVGQGWLPDDAAVVY